MNLQESIRRILREEDFIPMEDLNTVIKDYEDGFDVFIMNGDKNIGEISFVKDNLPNQYTIVDATIDDEYKGNRIYPKTIINLFKERPNLIINSVFRSPEAEKAWRYLLSNLPSNIGKSVKYYKDEDTTLYQLKLRNLQESIRRILREERKDTLKAKLISMIKNEGTKFAANLVGGMDNLFRFLDIHNPIQFLKIFKGLNIEIDGNDIIYKTDEGVIQFILNEKDYGYIKLAVGSRILDGVSHFYKLGIYDGSPAIKLWFKNEYNIKGDIQRAVYFLPSGDIIYAD